MKYIPLEHWNNRDEKIDMLVLHCSALSAKEMISVLNVFINQKKKTNKYIEINQRRI